ncbi:hypothetical protein [Leifsonia sp. Leaf264]|uniref:hypothetical protein n=1 Tax=Leifsonia sp. Leaf264 TaxID=1736314 RepID=UPI0006F68BEE|nr:hypothetical protein [Leifsonia sp. Leaf264]KQO98169.1 hypothetical protein ASF30_08905 [Leifsonia sp. Leaf264]
MTTSIPTNPGFESTVERDPAGSGQFHARKGEPGAPLDPTVWVDDQDDAFFVDHVSTILNHTVYSDDDGLDAGRVFAGADAVYLHLLDKQPVVTAQFNGQDFFNAIGTELADGEEYHDSDVSEWLAVHEDHITEFLDAHGASIINDDWENADVVINIPVPLTARSLDVTFKKAADKLNENAGARYIRDGLTVPGNPLAADLVRYANHAATQFGEDGPTIDQLADVFGMVEDGNQGLHPMEFDEAKEFARATLGADLSDEEISRHLWTIHDSDDEECTEDETDDEHDEHGPGPSGVNAGVGFVNVSGFVVSRVPWVTGGEYGIWD